MESESTKSQLTTTPNLLVEIAGILQSIVEKKTFKEFRKPVDEVKDEAPGYYALIKKPMDLKMMALKLKQREYQKPADILADLMLICENCKEYYKDPKCSMREKCAKLEEYIDHKWKKTAKQLKKDGLDIKTARFDYSKLATQASLEQPTANTKQEPVKAPKIPVKNDIPIKNDTDETSKNQTATNIPQQVSHPENADKLENSGKNKQEAKSLSDKENFIDNPDAAQDKYISKKKESSVVSEFDSDKETTLTRKFSGYSGFVAEGDSKEIQKMPTQNISSMSIEELPKPGKALEKIEEEPNSPFNSSIERMIDNFDQEQEISNSRLEVVDSNLPIIDKTPEKKDARKETPNKNEMVTEAENENKNFEEKQLVTPTQPREECKRPEISPEKEPQQLLSKIKDFSKSMITDNAPLLLDEKPQVEEQNGKGTGLENKTNSKENIDNWDGVIRINVSTIMKSYEEYAKSKIPKFVAKIQKYIKSLNKHVQTFDIKDEEFLKLKHEVENLRLWNKSWNYSRILLYLYNAMAFFKVNHDINSEVFTKKDVKKTVSLVKKSFFYLREAIRVLCIKFTKEETEAFHKMRNEYKATLDGKVREYEEEELKKMKAIKLAELEKQQQLEQLKREEKSQNKRQAPKLESKSSKKVKLEDDDDDNDDEYEGMEVSEEEEDEFMADIPKRKGKAAPKKNKRRFIRGPIIIKKKEAEDDHFYDLSDDDIKLEMEVKKDLQTCLNQVTNNLKTKDYLASLRNQILTSWKRGEPKIITPEKPNEKEVIQIAKMEEEIKQDSDEPKESPFKREFIPDISFNMPFDEDLQYKPQKLSVFEEEEQSTSAEDQVSEAICSPLLTVESQQKRIAKIFEPEFAMDVIKIKQKLGIDFTDCEIDMNSKYEKKLTAIFFCNTIENKLRGLLKLRGFDYKFNLDHQDDETLSKLLLLRIELKQEIKQDIKQEFESEEEDRETATHNAVKKELRTLKVHNALSADIFNNFLTLSDKRAAHAYKLQNYEMLIQPWEMAQQFEQLNLIEKILGEVHQGPWRKQENCGAYYYAEPNIEYESDSEYNYWDIGILTPVENFFSFHIELNDKLIF